MAKKKPEELETSAFVSVGAPKDVEDTEEGVTSEKPRAKRSRYFCKRSILTHPFQNIRIPTAPPGVPLDEDNWLECQIKAGHVVKYVEPVSDEK